jgi:hypothetical protein
VAVFPCGADKAPRVAGGFKAASSDLDVVAAMPWDEDGMIGAAIAPGTVVIDVDPRNGGTETFSLACAGKEQTETRTVKTRSGGWHYYYAVPESVELRAHLGPGVDVKRAGKGYVIVPPSEGYRLLNGMGPAPMPEWLVEELTVPTRPEGVGEASAPKFFPYEAGTAYGLRAMEGELGKLAMAREGGRNDALNRAAFALAQLAAGGELDEERAKDELMEQALRIGLEPEESKATIASGWSSGEQEPRQAPEAERALPSMAASDDEVGDAEAEGRFWVDWQIDEPALPFYCHPVLPKNAYVLVYGATEASKSMSWVGLLAGGSHHGVRSSIYSLENPPATDRERLRRWAPERSNFRLTNEPIDFNDPRQVEALVRREKDWGDGRGTDVILVDTYSHAFNSRSEDGNAKAIEFARRVRFVMQQVGCSVVVIDHTGYAQEDEPRDASAKRQQVDVAVLMKKQGEWRPGQPSRFSMKNNKAARFANPFQFLGEIRDTRDKGLELGWLGDSPKWAET